MAIDALRSYLQLASGLTDVTKERAKAAAQALVSGNPLESGTSAVTALGTTVTANAGALADDLVAASKANRKLLVGLIRSEIDRAVHRLGLATGDEVTALSERVARMEGAASGVNASSATKSPASESAARRTPAKKTATKTSARKKTAVKKTAVKQTSEAQPSPAPSTAAIPSSAAPSAEAPPATTEPDAAVATSTVPSPMASSESDAGPSTATTNAAAPPPAATDEVSQ